MQKSALAIFHVKLHFFIAGVYLFPLLYLNVATFFYILSGDFRVALPDLQSICMSSVVLWHDVILELCRLIDCFIALPLIAA